MAEYSFWDKL